MSSARSYSWYFGDGRTSTEPSPKHIYQMPGIYNGYVRVVDEYGNVYIDTFTVYVYDQDLTDVEGVHATYTNKCYRAAILAKQGTGITEWGGDNWLWPEAYMGAQKAITRAGDNVSLVLNRRNGRFYRIGISELWLDRSSTYGGQEIPTRLRLKEHLAVAGEQNMLEHVETHVTIRPYKEDYRGQSGYTEDGLRNNQQLTLKIYKDGEQNTPLTKVQDAPIYGDYMYGKRAKGKRLQMQFETTSSAYRITKVLQVHENSNERVGPAYAVSSESNWQREFASPDLWLVRNKSNPMRNKATGQDVSGSYAALTTGPDAVAQSGMMFGAGNGLLVTLPAISEATLGIWLSFLGGAGTVWTFPQFSVRIVVVGTDYYLRITDGVWNLTNILSWDGVSWVFLAITIDASTITLYENGSRKMIWNNPGTGMFGGTTRVCDSLMCSAFDIRRVPRVISAGSLAYYYDNVITEGGNILPIQK